MSYASILAIFWTCLLSIEIGVERGVGTLDGYFNALCTMNSISSFIKLWCHFMDDRVLWMIKLWAFHSIMISRFAAIRMWRWFICEFSMMMMVLSSPFNKYVDSIVYWVVILGEVIDWIFRDCFYTLFDGYTIQECHHTCNYGSEGNYKLLLFSYNRRCTSLPRKLMVLSCVQLHEPFVGWLEKLGYQYGKFLRDLNRIGLEGTCMFNKSKGIVVRYISLGVIK